MQELSLNILDVAQNSVSAGASLVEIGVCYSHGAARGRRLTITIIDNGRGMSPQVVEQVTDPFYTTRTTRAVGLGVPLFQMAAELADGSFSIQSKVGVGTRVTATLDPDHIDAMPMGDLCGSYLSLVQTCPGVDFVLEYQLLLEGEDGVNRKFTADTRQFREILGDVELSDPQVILFLQGYLTENLAETQAAFTADCGA